MMEQKSGPTPISGEEMELTRRDQNANVVLQKEPRLIPQTQQNNPSKPAVSVSASVVYTSSDLKSSVEFVTSGSRGSPVLLYSSAVDQVPRKLASAKEITKNSHSVHCESRPRVIASVGELRPPKSEVKSEMRSYIAETLEDEPRLYMSQKSRKKEMRTAVAEYEFKHDYPAGLVHSDRVKDFRPRAQDSLHTNDYASHACTKNNTPEITHEQRDAHKNKVAHDLSDGVLMMSKGMAEEKVRRGNSHSPRQLDDGYISTFSVPVFQPSRFSPGVELYDLPNGGFPLRTSSRIFMPPSHQLFPSSSHPAAAMATYSPHIIATIGPEPGAVYPLHIPGFYPPELSFPVDAGVSVLRS